MWQICLMIVMLVLRSYSYSTTYTTEEDLIERRKSGDKKKAYRKLKKYIKCQVCEFAAECIHTISLRTMDENIFDENVMYNVIVETCNPWSHFGVWTHAMDLVINEENELKLINKKEMGQCHRKCETVKSVCRDVITFDAEGIAEYIWTNKHEMDNLTLTQYMCSNVCGADRNPKVPKKLARKYNIGNEKWVKMTEQEKQERLAFAQKHFRMKQDL
eukprot:UN09060